MDTIISQSQSRVYAVERNTGIYINIIGKYIYYDDEKYYPPFGLCWSRVKTIYLLSS